MGVGYFRPLAEERIGFVEQQDRPCARSAASNACARVFLGFADPHFETTREMSTIIRSAPRLEAITSADSVLPGAGRSAQKHANAARAGSVR